MTRKRRISIIWLLRKKVGLTDILEIQCTLYSETTVSDTVSLW